MWLRKRSSSPFVRVLGQLVFVLVVMIVASTITDLLVPMPFHVEYGHTYTGDQATQMGQVMDRRFWIGIPVLIVTALILAVARSSMRARRSK